MELFKLECLTEDGSIETNGYFLSIDNALIAKLEHDNYKMNLRYGIKQNIIQIETED